MKEIISKELLSAVLGFAVKGEITVSKAWDNMSGEELEWEELCFDFISYPLHYMAHKCKEWALNNGYIVRSSVVCGSRVHGFSIVQKSYGGDDLHIESEDTEPEAIFKACQWILENKATQ